MTVGTPCVEREKSAKHSKTDKRQGEPNALLREIYSMGATCLIGYFNDIHRGAAGTIEYTEDAYHQESGPPHKHQCQFHGGIFLFAASPNSDEQVHGDQCYFIEHEHGKHIHCDKEAEHSHAQQCEPQKIFFCQRFELPGSKSSGENNDCGKQQHCDADSIHPYGVFNVERFEPRKTTGKEHFTGWIGYAGTKEIEDQID